MAEAIRRKTKSNKNQLKIGSYFKKIYNMGNMPDEDYVDEDEGRAVFRAITDENPKLDSLKGRLGSEWKSDPGKRFAIFTKSPKMAKKAANHLSTSHGGAHAVALSDKIEIYQGGESIQSFTEKKYKVTDKSGNVQKEYDSDEWVQYVLDHHVGPRDTDVKTMTLTDAYTHGINLQQYDSIIHLDRDDWNAEVMSQRTARVWRQGVDPDKAIDEVTIDMVYSDKQNETDVTFDEAQRILQDYNERLFKQIIKDSRDVELGEKYEDIEKKGSSFFQIDDRLMELELSPYVKKTAKLAQETTNLETGE